jgi:hypothetical protein
MAKKKESKVVVSRRAMLARVNRALAADNQALRAYRAAAERAQGFEYFRIDLVRGAVIDTQVKLATVARQMELLKPYETLSD